MDTLFWLWSFPLFRAAVAGFGSAFFLDVAMFLRSKDPGDFFGQWNAKVALWRWAQGIGYGICGYFGVSVGS